MTKVFLTTFIAQLFVFSLASADTNPAYYQIDESSLTIQQVDSGVLTPEEASRYFPLCADARSPRAGFKDIINYGLKLWKIIQENRPVAKVETMSASALPKGSSCWADLEKWNTPAYKTFRISYDNMMGMNVIDFDFRFFYTYGGQMNGKGAFLANLTVVPMKIKVLWGFKLEADVTASHPINVGTVEDPIAALEMGLTWKASSVLKETMGHVRYYVQGDGELTQYD